MKKSFLTPTCIALLVTTPVGVAAAQARSQSGWEFELTPYLWTSSLEGDVGVRGRTTEVDLSFSDIVDVLNFGLLLNLEGRKGRWGFDIDSVYLKLSDEKLTPAVGVEGEVRQLFLIPTVTYRFARGTDALAGVLVTSIDTRLRFGATRGSVQLDDDKTWVDPMIGVRKIFPLTDKWQLSLRGAIGGFGVSSDFVWGAVADARYQINETVALRFGYRHLDIDYEDDGFTFNTSLDGLALGIGFKF